MSRRIPGKAIDVPAGPLPAGPPARLRRNGERRAAPGRPPALLVFGLLGAALAGALLLAVACGPVPIPPEKAARILAARLLPGSPAVAWSPQEETILLALRLPRALGAALVGAALAAAGALLQGLFRNPLADPYVVGTSGGAAVGAVLGMLIGGSAAFGLGAVPAAAFLGALGATAVVVRLATVGGRLPTSSVLLSGFAVSTLLAYSLSLLLVVSDRLQPRLPEVYSWLLGGVSVAGWGPLRIAAPLVLAGVLAGTAMARSLNAFSLGEEGAARLGVDVEREKRRLLAVGALLTATAVSLSGLVGFVGLIVPHAVRLIAGPEHRRLVPASALAGAAFLTLADLVARTALGWFGPTAGELPLGVVTAFVGGPFFLWLLRRRTPSGWRDAGIW